MKITSKQNSVIQQFKNPGISIVVEGEKLINEAVSAGFELEYLLFTEKNQSSRICEKIPGLCISDELSEYISDTRTPQGIFAMFERKRFDLNFVQTSKIMILDGVQDPGNVGAIIRSCEAFGFDGAVFSQTCADAYNSKVVRASAGSAFRLPIIRDDLCRIITELKQTGFIVWGTALDSAAVHLRAAVFSEKCAVIIGNEGNGICEEVLRMCDEKLYIPIDGAQSLNAGVAAGIVCYEMDKK
jgi:TrmH family RNA methyltransferase